MNDARPCDVAQRLKDLVTNAEDEFGQVRLERRLG
jgi:hypothetical protein